MKFKHLFHYLRKPVDENELEGVGVATETEEVAPVVEETQPEAPKVEEKSEQKGMTPADIARAVAETMKEYQPKPAAEAPKVKTIADVRRELDYYEVDDKTMDTIFNVEATGAQRAAAFAEVQRKMYAHNLKLVEHIVEERLSQARQEFEPVRSEYLQRQQQAQVDAFYKAHPGLADHKETVALIANKLPRENPRTGKPFTDSELVTNIVVATTNYLKSLGHEVDPKNSKANPNAEQTHSEVPKSKPLAGSGRSAPGSSPAPKTLSRDASIWSE